MGQGHTLSYPFLETFSQKLKKIINTFSITEKYFSKNENYYVSLEHILAKSLFDWCNFNKIIYY